MFMCDRTCDLFKVGNFNIKRCLLFLVCIMLLVACGENDPIEPGIDIPGTGRIS